MSLSTLARPKLISSKIHNRTKSKLNEYIHYSNLKTDRMVELEIKLQQTEAEVKSLKESCDALLKKYLAVFEENLTYKVDCPVFGGPIADCGGFDCSKCALLEEHNEKAEFEIEIA